MKTSPLIVTATLSLTIAHVLFATVPDVNQVFMSADRTLAVSNLHFRVGGQQIPVSVESDLDGACALLGFNNALPHGLLSSSGDHHTVSLHKNASFKGFVTGKKVEMLMCHFWPSIQCEAVTSSYHNTKHRGKKGLVFLARTVTCTNPWVGTDAFGYRIAYTTDVNAICPSLKHHTDVSSRRSQALSHSTVQLDSAGNFAGFKGGGDRYGTLTCHYEDRVL